MRIEQHLAAAVGGLRGTQAADTLCTACVDLFRVDAAAISIIFEGVNSGTLGVSSPLARLYDEFQFTYGEGPCLDSVTVRGPVLVADLGDPLDGRWPAYRSAMVGQHIRGVYALPIALAGEYIGALDLYRARGGDLEPDDLSGALAAAELAAMPMLDLLSDDLQVLIGDPADDSWSELASLTRVEVGQATGMLIAQLDVDPAEALVRLRAHAYATGRTVTDVAHDIVNNGLLLEVDR